jgi:bacteriorhodopsin
MLPIRYLEWSCTTPLLILLSALMVDAPVTVTVRVMVFDFLTILTGGLGLVLPFGARIALTIISCLFAVLWVLVSVCAAQPCARFSVLEVLCERLVRL